MASDKSTNESSGQEDKNTADAQNAEPQADSHDNQQTGPQADPLAGAQDDPLAEIGLAQKSSAKAKAEAAKENALRAAEAAKTQFKKAFAASSKDPAFISTFLDRYVKKLTSLAAGDSLYANIPKVLNTGHLALLILAAVSLVMGIIIGIRSGSFMFISYGVISALLLLAAQYVAVKSFILFSDIIARHPSKTSGPALTEILATLHLIGAFIGVFFIIDGILQKFLFSRIAYGIFFLVIFYLASGLLTKADKHLNVKYDENITLAEQLFGLLSLFSKIIVKLAPYIYTVGTTVMTLLTVPPLLILLIRGQAAWGSTLELAYLLGSAIIFALTPILLYILVMHLHLLADLLKSLLGWGNKKQ